MNENKQFVYGQPEAIVYYNYYYKDAVEYTLYIDVDEFAFSPNGYELDQYVRQKEAQGITSIRLFQQRFVNRVCYDNKLIIDIEDYFPMDTFFKSDKLIIRNEEVIPGRRIHTIRHSRGRGFSDILMQDMRFHHYNILERSIKYSLKR